MATYPVKYVNNAMRGAPVLSGTAGSLISVLDAFLVTGFGVVTAQSVTVAGGIATATVQAGSSFDKNCIVLVDGATPAALNGEQRVLTTSSTAITWATTAPNGTATGTITIKVAPVGGWEKKHTGTNKAVYRSIDPLASGFCWWVDDSGTTSARVRGFESMTDVDTGSGPFPTDAQISGGGYQMKSLSANAAAVRYDLIADSRAVLVAIGAGSSNSVTYTASPIRGFGDMLALRGAGDGYAVGISCGASSTTSGSANFSSGTFEASDSAADAIYMARQISGMGGAQRVGSRNYVGGLSISGADTTLGAFPSSVDGELKFGRRYVHAGDAQTPRANVPGVLHVPQSGVILQIAPRDILDGSGDMAGRRLLALGTTTNNTMSTVPNGIVLVDITGPWR